MTYDPVPWVAVVLIGLAILMLAEAAWVMRTSGRARRLWHGGGETVARASE